MHTRRYRRFVRCVAFTALARPPDAALHLIAAMIFRRVPAIQAGALVNPAFHDVMHFSMLTAGLFFWFSAFDPGPPPIGARYGRRIGRTRGHRCPCRATVIAK